MSRVFVIADTHFGHANVLKYTTRGQLFANIEEHDETLIENWNKTVTNRDVVFHLGDVTWDARKSFLDKTLTRLNGKRKYLVGGNHDDPKKLAPYFDAIYGVKDTGRRLCVLTHVPVYAQALYRWEFNIHGHTHDNLVLTNGKIDPKYVCVSCEHTQMRPIDLDELLTQIRGIPNAKER